MNTAQIAFTGIVASCDELLRPFYDEAIAEAEEHLDHTKKELAGARKDGRQASPETLDTLKQRRDHAAAVLERLKECEPQLRIPGPKQGFANTGETLELNGITFPGTPKGQPEPTVTLLGPMGFVRVVSDGALSGAIESGRLAKVDLDGCQFVHTPPGVGSR